jgi:hypothetical protein
MLYFSNPPAPNLMYNNKYRVLRKKLNLNPVISEPFDTGKFIVLCKKQ